MSRYLVLILEDERKWIDMAEGAKEALEDHYRFNMTRAEAVIGGRALQPSMTATSLRTDDTGATTVTDGPFVETKEVLGGFYLIDAADDAEALEIAREVPAPFGGLEVRPVPEFDGRASRVPREQCVQDAYARALKVWAERGVPARPAAWLTTTARNRALDLIRRDATLQRLLRQLVVDDIAAPDRPGGLEIPDDRLLCGLTTAEVARSFLVSEATMAARITRAKKKIAAARIPYRVPAPAELPERVGAVLDVVHLLLTDARRHSRTDAEGHLVLLADQDRAAWDRAEIAEGIALVHEALQARPPGRFALQAAIAAVHAEAPTWAATDWVELVGLYDVLVGVWPSPMVALNRAVAVGFARGAEAALAELDRLGAEPQLAGYSYLAAARADFLRRLGRYDEARVAYAEALLLTGNGVERLFLQERLAELAAQRP